jgi:hypothetical protein
MCITCYCINSVLFVSDVTDLKLCAGAFAGEGAATRRAGTRVSTLACSHLSRFVHTLRFVK